jgi:hypothetical protein
VDGFDPVFVYRFSMQDLQTSICSSSLCSKRPSVCERKRSKDIQATKNDNVRLIIIENKYREITSTFDSVIYLVAEERARGIRGHKEGDGEHIINNEESYPQGGH